MSFLKTTCSECGEIELPVSRVVLRVCEDDGSGVCVFRCPECGSRFVREANNSMIVMLLAVGIEVSHWSSALSGHEPADLGEITHEELETFQRRLGSESTLLQYLESSDDVR